jgi:hypothetical protein
MDPPETWQNFPRMPLHPYDPHYFSEDRDDLRNRTELCGLELTEILRIAILNERMFHSDILFNFLKADAAYSTYDRFKVWV